MFGTPDFAHSDIWHFNFALKYLLAETLKNGYFPFWSKDIGSGFPILGEGQIGMFNFVNILLFRFFDPTLAFNLGFLTIFLTTLIGSYLYGRLISLNRLSAIFLAVIFSLSGVFFTQVVHYNLVQAASFLPLEFFLVEKIIQTGRIRYGLLFALILSQQIFSGFMQTVLISLVGISLYFLLRNRLAVRKWLILVFSLLLGLALALPQIIPTSQLANLDGRTEGGIPLPVQALYPYNPKNLFSFLNPYIFGDPRNGTYPVFGENWGIFWESTGYLGIIPLFLTVFSKGKFKKIFLILGLVALILLLGKYTPFFFLFQLPPMSFFRVPARFLLLFVWAIAVLAALGLNSLQKKWLVIFIAIISFLDLGYFSLTYNAIINPDTYLARPETVKYLKSDPSWYRIYSLWSGETWNSIFLGRGWTEMDKFLPFRNALDPNQNLYWNISSIDSYTAMSPKRLNLFKALINNGIFLSKSDNSLLTISSDSTRLLSLSGVKYFLSPMPITGQSWQMVASSSGKIKTYVYQNRSTRPHAYLTSDYAVVKTVDEFLNVLRAGKVVAIEKPVSIAQQSGLTGEATVTKNSDLEVIVSVNALRSTLLILSDSFYPGWKATIDGVNTEILVANINQRAVIVPAGEHTVVFFYRPFYL